GRIIAGEELDRAQYLARRGCDLDRKAVDGAVDLELVTVVAIRTLVELFFAASLGKGGRFSRGEPNAVADEDGRRPTAAGNFRLPCDRLKAAPSGRQVD